MNAEMRHSSHRLATCLLAAALAGSAHAGEVTGVPAIFAPGVISGPAHDAAPAFSPDNTLLVFGRSDERQATLLVSRRTATGWSRPVVAPFSGRWHDMEPAFAPDGRWLVFVSDRPSHAGDAALRGHYQGGEHTGGHLWRVERVGDGWGEPQPLPATVNGSDATFAPSVAADGSLYFMHPDPATGKFRLFRAQYRDGRYEPPQPLPFSDGTVSDVDPAVAPDESFIVFGSGRRPGQGMDLFIAWRERGRWSTPVWMGDRVNSPGSDAEARLSPDHRTLYFSSERLAGNPGALRPAWDNGKYNIWRVALAPWLRPRMDTHASPPAGLARLLTR
jgi:Tol biopolymer transport system component